MYVRLWIWLSFSVSAEHRWNCNHVHFAMRTNIYDKWIVVGDCHLVPQNYIPKTLQRMCEYCGHNIYLRYKHTYIDILYNLSHSSSYFCPCYHQIKKKNKVKKKSLLFMWFYSLVLHFCPNSTYAIVDWRLSIHKRAHSLTEIITTWPFATEKFAQMVSSS